MCAGWNNHSAAALHPRSFRGDELNYRSSTHIRPGYKLATLPLAMSSSRSTIRESLSRSFSLKRLSFSPNVSTISRYSVKPSGSLLSVEVDVSFSLCINILLAILQILSILIPKVFSENADLTSRLYEYTKNQRKLLETLWRSISDVPLSLD